MGTEDDKGFDFDIPVVADRREFFEQEAVVAEPPGQLDSDLEPDDVAANLKAMRESASQRTGSAKPAENSDPQAVPPGSTPE
ncbi:MAG TPA: hypothetical protein VHI31_05130 [Actinomycetota bacterium]|nr:hypothetical protein [Actinomycetota bacterium]